MDEERSLDLSLDIKGIIVKAIVTGKTPKGVRLMITLPDGTVASVEEMRDIINGNGKDSH